MEASRNARERGARCIFFLTFPAKRHIKETQPRMLHEWREIRCKGRITRMKNATKKKAPAKKKAAPKKKK